MSSRSGGHFFFAVARLFPPTIRTNARLTAGGDLSKVPRQAVTLGMKPILMAKKILVSQSTSGDVPESGLDVLNQDGDSIEVALARQLVAA